MSRYDSKSPKSNLTPPNERQAELLRHWSAVALEQMPYFASLLYSLRVLHAPGLNTYAVDQHHRMYVDFDAVEKYGTQWNAESMLHEASHLLQEHGLLAKELGVNAADHKAWNYAADCAINDDLVEAGCKSFVTPAADGRRDPMPSLLGEPNWMPAPHYFGVIKKKQAAAQKNNPQPKQQKCSTCGQPKQGQSGQKQGQQPGNGQPQGQQGQGGQQPGQSGQGGQGQGQQGGNQPGGQSGPGGNQPGGQSGPGGNQPGGQSGPGGNQPGQGDGSGQQPGQGQGSGAGQPGQNGQGGGQPGGQSGPGGNQPGQGSGSGQGQECSECGQQPGQGQGNGSGQGNGLPEFKGCGSGAGSEAAPCELDEDDDLNGQAPAANGIEKERIRIQTATAIKNHQKSRGTVPAGMAEVADAILAPSKVPWQRILNSHVRKALASKRGAYDVDRSKRSRRHHNRQLASRRGAPMGSVVVPGYMDPIPVLEVIRDTSGSMSSHDLAVATNEVMAIAKKANVRGDQLLVTDVDAEVHSTREFKNKRDIVEVHGRGGTDMRVGITHAQQRRKGRAHVIVVLTDGGTPWPTERGPVPIIAGIVGDTEMLKQYEAAAVKQADVSDPTSYYGSFIPPEFITTVLINTDEAKPLAQMNAA